ncbi:transmembrane protein 182-like [Rhincodon typus]|uniref:transmembrane protein 182-like n=1 Tax=Rhincodon typus TaxID=259920 RepID=UPI002030FB96|nr:transmembrane protein 182-like [Rhincodon typus]
MNNLRVRLNCGRLFAAVGLVIFFLTSCTNYWLHAVTYPSLNNTELEQPTNSTGAIQKYISTEKKTTGSNQEDFTGIENSTETNQPFALKRSSYHRSRFNKYRILYIKQMTLTYHHEGFFWRCWFTDEWTEETILKFVFVNQPPSKCCIHAYYSPFPSAKGEISIEFESAIVYRKWWSAFMFLAVICISIGSVAIVFNIFCDNRERYKTVGVIFLLSGFLYIVSIVMYVYWISAIPQMMKQGSTTLNIAKIVVSYGWSFMAAPVGILFSLISGLLFFNIPYKEKDII